LAVFGARVVSSAMSKVPQLVATTAVASSPFSSTCLGALKLTFFGAGAATFLQPPELAAVVVADELSLPPPREIRIAATTPPAKTANTARMIKRWSVRAPIGAKE